MAMKDISKKIHEQQSLIQIEKTIPSVDEVFRLQGEEELRLAEDKFLPKAGSA